MANDNKFRVKNGLETQNISFLDTSGNEITASIANDTISFEGNSGQLFSITDSLSGTIFSVNDISGIPSIEVDDDGSIRLAEFSGNVLIGTSTDDGTNRLQVAGGISASGTFSSGAIDIDVGTTSGTFISLTRNGGTEIGRISYSATDNISIHGSIANHAGINFGTNIIVPMSGGAEVDNTVELGDSTRNMKAVHTKSIQVAGTEVLTSGRSLTNIGDVSSTGAVDFQVAGGSSNVIVRQTGQAFTSGATSLTGLGVRNTGTSENYNIFEAQTGVGTAFQVRNNGDVRVLRDLMIGSTTVIDSSRNITANNLTVGGNLTVNGTTTTLNTATLDVEDKNITLNYGAGDTSASADGAGITIQDAVSSGNDATILWDATNDKFEFSHSIEFDATATTTNQSRGIFWTGYDKEGTTDYSDAAYIQHTTNTGGHAGSVLVISSQNDSNDGIAFATNASSKLKHNGNNIATEPWVTGLGYITGNQTITLTGDVTGSGTTSIATTVVNDSHNHTYFSVSGISDLNSISNANNLSFRPFVSNFQATNRSGSNYNGGFEVGTGATNYGAQLVFEANASTTAPKYRNKINGTWGSWYTLWGSGNDGSGSGLDADLLDGQHGSYYAAASSLSSYVAKTGDTMTGALSTTSLAISGTTVIDSNRRNIYLDSFAGGDGNGIFFRSGFTSSSNGYNCSITVQDHNGNASDGLHISAYDGVGIGTGANTYSVDLLVNSSGDTQLYGQLLMASTVVIDSSRNLKNVTVTSADAEYGQSLNGNFGQWQAHSTYTNFNTDVAYWGWNYIQGTGNAPAAISNQWYRNRVSLGNAYGFGSDGSDYWLEMAYPRYGNGAGGNLDSQLSRGTMWVRTCEAGTEGSWSEIGANLYSGLEIRGASVIDTSRNVFAARLKATTAVHPGSTGYWKLRDNGGGAQLVAEYSTSDALSDANIKWRVLNDGTTQQEGSLRIGSTTVIDSSRNLTNIGTISSGAITSSGTFTLGTDLSTTNAGRMRLEGTFANTGAGSHPRITFNDDNFGIGAGGWGTTGNNDDIYIWTYHGAGRKIRFASTTDGSTDVSNAAWYTNATIDDSGNFDLARGNLEIGGTTVIDSSRNLTNIGTISSGAITTTGEVSIGAVNNTYNLKAFGQDADSFFGVYDDANNSANIILTRSDGATIFRVLGHTGATTIAGTLSSETINIASGHSLSLGSTTVIDSSRNLTNIGTVSSTHFSSSANINSTGVGGITVGGGRVGFDQSGVRSWTQYAAGGNLLFASGDGNGAIQANNFTASTYQINSTIVIDSSRNLTNIGSITGSAAHFTSNYGGGTGDYTNVTTPPLKLETTSGYIRVPHISAHETISIVNNYETGKDVYWGEPNDTGTYWFRGRDLRIENAVLKIGSNTVIDSSRNLTNIGTISSGAVSVSGNSTITGSGSSGNALNVYRGSDSASALRVLNTGEVLVSSNYFYVDASAGAYFNGAIRARGGISNDNGDLSLNDNVSITGNLDVDGIIDNTRNNGSVAAPSTSDHTAGTRIKFYDTSATAFYAMGIESDTLWFNSDGNYKWYVDAALKVDFDSSGVVNAVGGYKVNGSTIVDSNRRFYVGGGSIQHSSRISFLNGSNGNTGSGAQGIAVESLYAGTSYSNTAPSGMVNALNGYQVGNTTVIDSSRNLTNVGSITASGTINTDQSLVVNSNGSGNYYLYLKRAVGGDGHLLFQEGSSLRWQNVGGTDLNWYSYTAAATTFSLGGSGGADLKVGGYKINGTEVIDSSRNLVNIGTISSGAITATNFDLPIGGDITFYGDGDMQHSIVSKDQAGSNADDLRINSYGSIILNMDSNNNQTSGAFFTIGRHGGSASQIDYLFYISGENADVTTEGNVTAYGTISDIRKKENIQNISDPIEKVKKLNGVTFNYKKDGSKSTGLIAQELLEVLPEVVYTTKPIDGEEHYAVRYGNVVGLLVEAIKEQQTQIEELKAQVQSLKEK